MQTFVIVIHLMVVLAMIGFVLLQKSEGGGLGMGSSGGGFMSSRGTANVLSRATGILAASFFATSLLLSILAGFNRNPRSILERGAVAPAGPQVPGAPSAPLGSGGGVLDRLRLQEGGDAAAPSAPTAPGTPQVPQSQ
jgi:preprotein translocase subunit SecG